MRGYSVAEIRAAEKPLLDAGVPLMARASAALAAELRRLLVASRGGLVVLAGSGDNGGDALHAAAELATEGVDVWATRVGTTVHEAAWATAVRAGVREVPPDAVATLIPDVAIVVDGMRGIGGSGAGLRGTARDTALGVRAALDRDGAPMVVAVDVPSGIDADTGAAGDEVLPADVTVAFGAMKAGLLREPARSLAGRVILIDIGLSLQEA